MLATYKRVRGLGDVLSDAQKAFASIGLQSECQTYQTQSPTGGVLTNNVCRVPGASDYFDAGLAAQLTPAQLAVDVGRSNAASTPNLFQGDSLSKLTAWTAPPSVPLLPMTTTPVTNTTTPQTTVQTTNQTTQQLANQPQKGLSFSFNDWLRSWIPGSSVQAGSSANAGSNMTSPGSVSNLVPGPSISPTYQTTAPYVNSAVSWLEQTVPIGNWDIPIWALGLVGGVGVWMLMRKDGSGSSFVGRRLSNPYSLGARRYHPLYSRPGIRRDTKKGTSYRKKSWAGYR